ncbi:Opioid-binding protein/cell adhesion molecule [Dissostichus eleginoides]|uniref:Opioid-binding protein/cell adhesion molecule n=1 Tax=Dissostichus eleginoides TaxID=100907 RepID=A0AAD9EZZ8_DISEL|nr:Opioid-binding protein/cell adhesion molecule [Dissostichus eleginoides]
MRTVAEVFQQDAELMHDTMAETLAKAMLTYEFIAINSLLCDILGTIACLSKAFQLKSLSFANVQPAVTSTINVLRAMQIGDEGGPKFQEFLANIAENNGETCNVDSKVSRVAWLNRTTILFAGSEKWSLDPRVILMENTAVTEYSIMIQNVDVHDEGPYVCSILTNKKPKSTKVHVIVQGKKLIPPQPCQ